MHLGIETKVIGNDWKSAIDDAVKLANKLNITVLVNYANQYEFLIKPDMSFKELEEIKKTHIVIGL
jgi:hypothetical protein